MNHDELLIKVIEALEQHKTNYGLCKKCTTHNVPVSYPCSTIQAIEEAIADANL